MLTLDVAQQLIRQAVGRKALGYPLELDTRFDEMGLTSLDMAEVLFVIEDHLRAEIEIDETARPQTVGELIDVVNMTVASMTGSAT